MILGITSIYEFIYAVILTFYGWTILSPRNYHVNVFK